MDDVVYCLFGIAGVCCCDGDSRFHVFYYTCGNYCGDGDGDGDYHVDDHGACHGPHDGEVTRYNRRSRNQHLDVDVPCN